MYLLLLMLVPLIIGIVGMFASRGRINWKEFLVMEAVVLAVIGAGYLLATMRNTSDTEIWSGRVVSKHAAEVSCAHSYSCNCTSSTDSNGNTTETCQTCYEHSYDMEYGIVTSNGEHLDFQLEDSQGLRVPERFQRAYEGEPTAVLHSFSNPIKAAPDTVLWRRDAKAGFEKWLPPYPSFPYDYYYVNRFFSEGFRLPPDDERQWNWDLMQLNADLGASKKVNIIVGMIKNADPNYEFALEEHWLGGKPNDVVILMGVPDYPRVAWVRVVSWANEEFRVGLRHDIMLLTADRREQILAAARRHIQTGYVKRSWSDFDYLAATVQPSPTASAWLFGIGLVLCGGLSVYFYANDPFLTRYEKYGRFGTYGSNYYSRGRR